MRVYSEVIAMSVLLGTVIGMAEMFLSRGDWPNIRTANHTHIHHERQKKKSKETPAD